MPQVLAAGFVVAHGLITTMIGFGGITKPDAPAMAVPAWFGWWPGPFGRSWLIDATHLGSGASMIGNGLWLVAGLALLAAGLGWLGVPGARGRVAAAGPRWRGHGSRGAGPFLPPLPPGGGADRRGDRGAHLGRPRTGEIGCALTRDLASHLSARGGRRPGVHRRVACPASTETVPWPNRRQRLVRM